MADIILDLSGAGGLTQGFHGNVDEVTPRPERFTAVGDGEFAVGMFNPYLRKGYLSPITDDETALTLPGGDETLITSVEYDTVEDDVYLADRQNNLLGISTLGGGTLTLIDTIDDATYPERGFDEIHDLNIYELDGVRSLFVVGKGVPKRSGPITTLGTRDDDGGSITMSISVPPHSSTPTTKPTLVASARQVTTTSSNTADLTSFTVPSGTNLKLVFIVARTSNLDVAGSATYAGDAMTQVRNSSLGPSMTVWELDNPTPGTASIICNMASSTTILRVMSAFVFENAGSIEIGTDVQRVSASLSDNPFSIFYEPDFVSRYEYTLIGALSEGTTMTVDTDTYTEVDFNTNTYGFDGWWNLTTSPYGLMVSSIPLPVTSVSTSQSAWFPAVVEGGFFQEVESDYLFMRNADNGFSYLFADNSVHKVDGSFFGGDEGTVTKNVLLFPEYFTITDAVDYRSNLFIAIHLYPVSVSNASRKNFSGKCGIYVWNRISTQLSSSDFIELPGVREIKKIFVSPDQVLKLLVISDSGLTELREFGYNDSGGVIYRTSNTLGLGAYPQFPDGLVPSGDKTVWIANDGFVYAEKGGAVTKLYSITDGGTTEAALEESISTGALLFGTVTETGETGFRDTKQVFSMFYNDGTDKGSKIYPLDLKNGSNTAQTPHPGNVYTGVKYIPVTSRVRRVRIYNAPVSSSGSTVIATVKMYFNQSTSATMPNGMTKSITLDEAKRGYVDFNISKPYVHAVQLEFEWATGTPLGDDMYMPSAAIISTEDTGVATPDGE